MDDGELEFSNQELFSNSSFGDLPSSCSIGGFFDDLVFKDAHACTHTHTCNPPGPDNSHTHTCVHVHTKTIGPAPAASEDKAPSDDTAESTEKKGKKRPSGNREAVRKYREKKKARVASLEDEVVKLKAMNQQLVKRLQNQALLEAEIARLKCLLVDIRGRIEGEIGSFPYQKPTSQNLASSSIMPGGAYLMNPCNVQCDDQLYCPHPGSEGKNVEGGTMGGGGDFDDCEFENLQCFGSHNSGFKDLPGCGVGNGGLPSANTSNGIKRKGAARVGKAG
ncbi:OLC1v1003501C1 [Oldenlandia corymbosa var. corymbosa]|uniref:OLC1v1003501C1 n=1 Tax=Oldenlandia corymbosa var. corymbosa TaxID=529605 RepID=A0AAV1DCJ8_OLDCO|nr:OLC1v1003501C1 [Oldenlandia corymbosa var. corymbosa]